ncbi:MAG TPA: hypothetical protein ENK06_10585 [Gammaproteobacteria bacterium]|nr:hypothetical protein [Gammaproteobacteria bacterium]
MPKINNDFSERDLKCAEWMLAKIRDVHPKFKQPRLTRWATEIRLMRQRDKRSYEEIFEVFTWANDHDFWKMNILSPQKLRAQFDRLTLQKQNAEAKNQKLKPTKPKPKITRPIQQETLPEKRILPGEEYYAILRQLGFDPKSEEDQNKQNHKNKGTTS